MLALRGHAYRECDREIYHAPPEVVATSELTVRASPAQDIWAVAVMAFQCFLGRPALDSEAQVRRCAYEGAPYPWELPGPAQPAKWRDAAALRAVLEPCLARAAEERPSAAQLLARLAAVPARLTPPGGAMASSA